MSDWIKVEESGIDERTSDGYYWCFEERYTDPYVSYFCSIRKWFFDREGSKDWPDYISEIKEPEPPEDMV